jgi:hypothetical protein
MAGWILRGLCIRVAPDPGSGVLSADNDIEALSFQGTYLMLLTGTVFFKSVFFTLYNAASLDIRENTCSIITCSYYSHLCIFDILQVLALCARYETKRVHAFRRSWRVIHCGTV